MNAPIHSDLLFQWLSYASVPVIIAGPTAGWLVFRAWRSWSWKECAALVTASGTCVLFAFLDIVSPLSFRGFGADAAVIALGYLAFCSLACATIAAAPRLLRFPVGVLFSAALAPLMLTTLSGIGVLAILGGLLPRHETALAPHLLLRTSQESGASVAHNLTKLELVQQPGFLPGLEISRYVRWVRDDECAFPALHLAISRDKAVVLCGRRPLDTVSLLEE